jgi:hypothetical protein
VWSTLGRSRIFIFSPKYDIDQKAVLGRRKGKQVSPQDLLDLFSFELQDLPSKPQTFLEGEGCERQNGPKLEKEL